MLYEVITIYKEIDTIETKIDIKIQEILDNILPEAFALIKETRITSYNVCYTKLLRSSWPSTIWPFFSWGFRAWCVSGGIEPMIISIIRSSLP